MTRTPIEWSHIASRAALVGGEVLKRFFRKVDPATVDAKKVNDWVSEADRASEQAIIDFLRKEAPHTSIYTEESGYLVPENNGNEYCWIIDPLDGTTNFLRGFPLWAVSIGLEYRPDPSVKWGNIIAGSVLSPMTSELFHASAGGGAFRNDERIAMGPGHPLEQSLLGTGYPFRVKYLLDQHLSLFHELLSRCADIRRPGAAAIDLCYTAMGVYDGFWELDLFPWDIAAGKLIIQEAGGLVADFSGHDDPMTTGDIIAANPRIFGQISEAVKHHFSDVNLPRPVDKSPPR